VFAWVANTVEAIQDGRIHIEKINGSFLFTHGGSPAEYGAGLKLAIDRGWLWKHESGTYVKFTQAGAELPTGERPARARRGPPMSEDFRPVRRYSLCFPPQSRHRPPMTFTIKVHHEAYYAVFTRKTMEDALAKANELVDAGYSAVTIQDENGHLYLQSDFVLLGQKPTTEQ
jgi:hypothetical protein